MRFTMTSAAIVKAVSLLSLATAALAYIPALPVNDTSTLISSDDQITLAWMSPAGGLQADLSRQLIADVQDDFGNFTNETSTIVPWTKYAKGVLVHFSEDVAGQAPSLVPWIALISCDTNGTTFSMEDDIFTLARDRGAQAALLYSITSEGCLMNQDYLQNFEKPLDVYATRDKQNARVIETQFQLNVANSAYFYNSQMLNDSMSNVDSLLDSDRMFVNGGNVVTNIPVAVPTPSVDIGATASGVGVDVSTTFSDSIAATTVPSQRYKRQAYFPATTTRTTSASFPSATNNINYLGAVLASSNITVGRAPNTTTSTPTTQTNSNNGPNTGLAMIILYAITGVVTFMFLIVILSGAVRAIRHPERYGPRGANLHGRGGGAPQSRAGGLTRAILDTFPVVKFGRTADDQSDDERERERHAGDVESGKGIELDHVPGVVRTVDASGMATMPGAVMGADGRRRSGSSSSFVSAAEAPGMIEGSDDPLAGAPRAATAAENVDVNPADVDDGTTCPICVCEFEQGEDVRILPCDGRHRFHQACIDPWLLQVSSLCPLCRLDLSGQRDESPSMAIEEEQANAAGEQQVISNLRAMLHGHSRNSTNATSTGSEGVVGAGHRRGSTAGTAATSASRFFRYVANRRRQQQQGGQSGTPSAQAVVPR